MTDYPIPLTLQKSISSCQQHAAQYLIAAVERVMRRPTIRRADESADRVDTTSGASSFAADIDFAIFLDAVRSNLGEHQFRAAVSYLVLEQDPRRIARACMEKPPLDLDEARRAVEMICQGVLLFGAGVLANRRARAAA